MFSDEAVVGVKSNILKHMLQSPSLKLAAREREKERERERERER